MHCDRAVQAVGFEPLPPEWPSCYFHKKLKLFLVVYADDCKLSGPEGSMRKGWKLLRAGLNIEPEARWDQRVGFTWGALSSELTPS